MEEKKKRLFDYCKDEEKIMSFAWRSAFLAKICNIELPTDVVVNSITPEQKQKIAAERYSEALAHLLIMYGAGYICFDNLHTLSNDVSNYRDEIFAAENFVIEQSYKDEKERVSEDIVQNILLCTINSKKYPEIQPVSFEIARSLCESTHTTIRNGFVFVKDVEFLTQLLNADECLGNFKNGKLEILDRERVGTDIPDDKCIEKNLNKVKPKGAEAETNKAAENKENAFIIEKDEMPDMPFVINLNNTYHILKIYEKPYAVEFIHYAKTEGIPFDENFENAYTEYVRRNKRTFTVAAISRKRDICRNEINWFDYGTTKYADKQIIIDNKFDITEHIDISEKVADDLEMSDEKLVEKAVEKFLEYKQLPDKSVLEITFCGKKVLYLLRDGKLDVTLESEKFRKIPFDYNNVWTTVMEWSRSKLIKKTGDSIVVPESEMNKLPEKDRGYAKRMIEEQYSLKKGSNKMLQKLSELKSYAKKEFDIKTQQNALKKDTSKRESGITEDDKN